MRHLTAILVVLGLLATACGGSEVDRAEQVALDYVVAFANHDYEREWELSATARRLAGTPEEFAEQEADRDRTPPAGLDPETHDLRAELVETGSDLGRPSWTFRVLYDNPAGDGRVLERVVTVVEFDGPGLLVSEFEFGPGGSQ